MISKTRIALIAIVAAAGMTSPASAEPVRNYGSLLFDKARRFYDSRLEKAQMRFAPTTCLDAPPPRD
jgi:hypothetical protein